eukprot:177599_1
MGCVGACLGSCASSALCHACNSCAPKSNNSCYSYAFLTLVVSMIAVILQMFGDRNIDGFTICSLFGDEFKENCEHNASPFRILSTLSWFYIIHIISTRVWASFHRSFWTIKLFLFTIAVICTYFIPNSFFEGYAKFAVAGASLFIVLQIVIFINMCYDWNEAWVSREWFSQTICATVLMYVSAIVLYVIGFTSYGKSGCSSNQANLSCSIIVAFLLTLLSIYAPHGAILPSAGVTLYLSWILFSGLSYVEDPECNNVTPNNYIKVISMVIFIVGVGYFCLSNYSQSDMQSQNENKIKEESRTSETREDADVEKGEHKKDEDEMDVADIKMVKEDEIDEDEQEKRLCCIPSDPVQASNIHFYILMFFGCLYIMMVMTKWEWTANPKDMDHDGKSNQIVAANIIAHWAVAVLYLVTLIAPMICPGRFVYDDVDDTE